jgi:hypothetical protein
MIARKWVRRREMEILLAFEDKFPIDKVKLTKLIQQKAKFIKFCLYDKNFSLSEELVTKPKTFIDVNNQFNIAQNKYDKIFCFTLKQYDDNFFFHEHNNITIFSFFAWSYLTDLPISNGILCFIIKHLALQINHTDFRHHEITGCIYDFLKDKRGIDEAMRQSRFCPNCLEQISTSLEKNDSKILDDLQVLMNFLSEASKWNKDIITFETSKSNLVTKRNPRNFNTVVGVVRSNSIMKRNVGNSNIVFGMLRSNSIINRTPKNIKRNPKNPDGIIRVAIASPSDTNVERKYLLDNLDVRFRRGNHERHCGFRIVADGFEYLATQSGCPQDIINKKLIAKSDFVIAFFRHKLGTPTKDTLTGKNRAESGTVEEISQAQDITKRDQPIGMIYFFSKAPVISLACPDKNKIEEEWNRLSKFKEEVQEKMLYKLYTNKEDLLSTILTDLENNIRDYFVKRGK